MGGSCKAQVLWHLKASFRVIVIHLRIIIHLKVVLVRFIIIYFALLFERRFLSAHV